MQAALENGAAAVRRCVGAGPLRIGAAAQLLDPSGRATEAAIDAADLHFPASLVKLFHAVAFLQAVDAGALQEAPEDARALDALLRHSSNDADQYLMRRLCPPPPENGLPPPPAFVVARAALNDRWTALDPVAYAGLKIGNATYEDGPFGLEAETRRALGQNRMSARAGLAILKCIAGEDDLIAPESAARLRGWLDRAWARPPRPAAGVAGQVDGFLAAGFPAGAQIWSKGGWTETTRHDAVHALMPDGSRLFLVVLVSGSDLLERADLLPAFASAFLDHGTIS